MNKYNQREVLIHIVCNYYEITKKQIVEGIKVKNWVMGKAIGMYSHIADLLSIGTPTKIGEQINRKQQTISYYKAFYFDKSLSDDVEFESDKKEIMNLFFMKEKALMADYYMTRIPKQNIPQFIDYVERFRAS